MTWRNRVRYWGWALTQPVGMVARVWALRAVYRLMPGWAQDAMANLAGAQLARDLNPATPAQLAANRGWAFAANRQIGGRAARVQPELSLVERTAAGVEKTPVHDHPFLDLIAQPNCEESGLVFQWRQALHVQTAGRFTVRVEPETFQLQVGSGSPLTVSRLAQMILMPPERTYVLEDPMTGALVGYEYRPLRGERVAYRRAPATAAERQAWWRTPYPFVFQGGIPGADSRWQSPASAGAYAIDIEDQLDQLHLNQIKHGVWSQMIFYLLKDFTDPERFRNAVVLLKQGVGQAGEPLVLSDKNARVEKNPVSNAEMQFPELSRRSRQQILAVEGASEALVGLTQPSSRASVEAQERILALGTVDPILGLIADAYNAWVLPLYRGQGQRAWYTVSYPSSAAVDELTQADWLTKVTGGPVLTPNEGREVIGKPSLPGGDQLRDKPTVGTELDKLLGGTSGQIPIKSANGDHPLAALAAVEDVLRRR